MLVWFQMKPNYVVEKHGILEVYWCSGKALVYSHQGRTVGTQGPG